MRKALLAAVAAIALSACGHNPMARHDNSNPNWKKDAMAECDKKENTLEKQTCLDAIKAVEHERDKVP